MDTVDLQLEHFTPLLGETFVADFGNQGSLDLVITEATDRPTGNPNDVAFSVLFRGPVDPVFQQALVPIEHPDIGKHGLFLVAVSEDDEGRVYEAIFTRILD